MTVNKIFLLGYLGQDPLLRKVNGESCATFSIATSEKWTGPDGKPHERTDWHRVVTWGALADAVIKYMFKGSRAHVEGRLQTRSFENDAGETVWVSEVVALQVIFLGNRRRDQSTDPNWPPNQEFPPE